MTHNFCRKEQTISEKNLNTPHVCVTFGEIQKSEHSKHFKEFFFPPLTKVFLEVEILSNEKGQSLQHLILKRNHHKT